MALIACPECGHQLSEAAPACPGCGVPFAHVITKAETPPEGTDMPALPLARRAVPAGVTRQGAGGSRESRERNVSDAPAHPVLRGITMVAGMVALLLGLATLVLGLVVLSLPDPVATARGGGRITTEDIERAKMLDAIFRYLALVAGTSVAMAIGGTAVLVAEQRGER